MYEPRSSGQRRCPGAPHRAFVQSVLVTLGVLGSTAPGVAAKVTLDLGRAENVVLVGALDRWDEDGNERRPVDTKAKIDEPHVDFAAKPAGDGKWVFDNLPQGKYDFLILTRDRVRIEGFYYTPVLEFDPVFEADADTTEENREFILENIAASRHYENKVVPLYMGGDDKAVRVLVMLLRDLPTSYTPGAGTIRHEIWQYTWNYGGWVKEKRTRVLDRILMQVSELRQWTWLWEPKLGGIEVETAPLALKYDLPKPSDSQPKGLRPY